MHEARPLLRKYAPVIGQGLCRPPIGPLRSSARGSVVGSVVGSGEVWSASRSLLHCGPRRPCTVCAAGSQPRDGAVARFANCIHVGL